MKQLSDSSDVKQKVRLPILLFSINYNSEKGEMGIISGYEGIIRDCRSEATMMAMNSDNWNIMKHKLKMIDGIIRAQSINSILIEKKISLRYTDNSGSQHNAYIVYLRRLTEQYTILSQKEKSGKERFEQLLAGIQEGEYPKDEYDTFLLDAVKESFPEANVSSRLLIIKEHEINLLNWLEQRTLCKNVIFNVIPDLNSDLENSDLLCKLINTLQFPIHVYVESRADINLFEARSFNKEIPVDQWKATYDKLILLKNSIILDPVRELRSRQGLL